MKVKTTKDGLNNREPPPPIIYKPDPSISNTPADKLDLLKVDIKTQPVERGSKAVVIYVLLFWMGSTEALLKFVYASKQDHPGPVPIYGIPEVRNDKEPDCRRGPPYL